MSTVALALAAANPHAKLPCPICANTVNATNLSSHVAKVHADAQPIEWSGRRWFLFPARLSIGDGAITLKTLLGARTVALPCTIEVGSLVTRRSDVILEHVAHTVKTGWYLRLGDRLTIGCRSAAHLKDHWSGWTQGKRRRVPDLWADRRVLVEIEYALVAAGALHPLAC